MMVCTVDSPRQVKLGGASGVDLEMLLKIEGCFFSGWNETIKSFSAKEKKILGKILGNTVKTSMLC